MNKKLYLILSEILGISAEDITEETSVDNTPSWDSFNGLMIVAELEKSYGVTFTIDEVVSVKKVADIKAALDKYAVEYEC
ncbi:MAG: acyl carrier protein [Parcubacteria group bacterium]|nr:acyl carrier protein [Parcubacteria group bacterium]